jgi:hypothetical protein
MAYYKTFNNHPRQATQFQGNDRVVRLRDGEMGCFQWESCPMNGHNDAAGAWIFEMDCGEKVYLNGSGHNNFPWRIPNRFRHAIGAEVGVDPDDAPIDFDYPPGAFARTEPFNSAEDANARVCELVDMIVDDKATTEDYNYVVQELLEMIEYASLRGWTGHM